MPASGLCPAVVVRSFHVLKCAAFSSMLDDSGLARCRSGLFLPWVMANGGFKIVGDRLLTYRGPRQRHIVRASAGDYIIMFRVIIEPSLQHRA